MVRCRCQAAARLSRVVRRAWRAVIELHPDGIRGQTGLSVKCPVRLPTKVAETDFVRMIDDAKISRRILF